MSNPVVYISPEVVFDSLKKEGNPQVFGTSIDALIGGGYVVAVGTKEAPTHVFSESMEFQAWFNNTRVDHEMLGLDYWQQQAARLQSELIANGQTMEFIDFAGESEILAVAGEWFSTLSANTRAAIVSTMRK